MESSGIALTTFLTCCRFVLLIAFDLYFLSCDDLMQCSFLLHQILFWPMETKLQCPYLQCKWLKNAADCIQVLFHSAPTILMRTGHQHFEPTHSRLLIWKHRQRKPQRHTKDQISAGFRTNWALLLRRWCSPGHVLTWATLCRHFELGQARTSWRRSCGHVLLSDCWCLLIPDGLT